MVLNVAGRGRIPRVFLACCCALPPVQLLSNLLVDGVRSSSNLLVDRVRSLSNLPVDRVRLLSSLAVDAGGRSFGHQILVGRH